MHERFNYYESSSDQQVKYLKNIVTPLNVPWMVSTSELELKLQSEADVLKVPFLAFFGDFVGDEKRKYQHIVLIFSGVKAHRYFPEFSERDSERLDGYVWQRIPEYRDASGSLAGHVTTFNKIWMETAICPNPSAFEVENSSWIKDLNFDKTVKHFLIVAGDYNLEVLAKRLQYALLASNE